MLGTGLSLPRAVGQSFLVGFATFSGSNDDIVTLTGLPLQFSTSIVIQFDIKTVAVTKFVINGQDAANDGITIQLDASGKVFFQVNSSTGKITSTGAVNDDAWHTIRCVVTGGTAMELFVDGASQGTDTCGAVNVTTDAKVGTRAYSTPAANFVGSIRRLLINIDA